MKQKHLSALLRDDITTVKVSYYNSVANRDGLEAVGQFTYKILKADALNLALDQMVVVPVAKNQRSGGTTENMEVAIVREIHDEPQIDPDFDGDYKWVACSVDVMRYNAILDHERLYNTTLLHAERAVKRDSLVERYKQAMASSPALSATFEELRKGPLALAAPAAAPSTSFKDAS